MGFKLKAVDLHKHRKFTRKINMVHSANKIHVKTAKTMKRIKIKKVKRNEELRNLYDELSTVLPSFGAQGRVCGTDVVLKAVQYIDQLHRRVADERGVQALQNIQQNAKNIALQQLLAMKAQTSQQFNKIDSEGSDGNSSA